MFTFQQKYFDKERKTLIKISFLAKVSQIINKIDSFKKKKKFLNIAYKDFVKFGFKLWFN